MWFISEKCAGVCLYHLKTLFALFLEVFEEKGCVYIIKQVKTMIICKKSNTKNVFQLFVSVKNLKAEKFLLNCQ